ncbi:MAG: NUDIX hydrolase, partial [Oscillochloris sp.]|nr:NUDIX hydrolase [Oscillochloris sp.]
MPDWNILSRETVLDNPPYLKIERHRVGLPDGRVIDNWQWIITPDYINVAAITAAGEFVLFRQTKYAVAGISLAPVGGYLEAGEDALATAQRELREEAGYASDHWTALGHYAVDGNRGAAACSQQRRDCQSRLRCLEESGVNWSRGGAEHHRRTAGEPYDSRTGRAAGGSRSHSQWECVHEPAQEAS